MDKMDKPVIYFLLPVFYFLFSANIGTAQTQVSGNGTLSQIGVGTGVSFTGYIDETNLPVSKYSNPLTYFIFGHFERGKWLHSFNVSFFWGDAKKREPFRGYIHIPCSTIRASMDYSFNYRLFEIGFYQQYIGPAIRTIAHYTGPLTGDGFNKLNPTGVFLTSIDLNLGHKFIINNRNSVFFSIKFPVFGYAVRPPYAGLDELWLKYLHEGTYLKFFTLGEITGPHNYFAFLGDIRYHYKINRKFSVYSGMTFEYSFISFYRPRRDLIFTLHGGVTYLF